MSSEAPSDREEQERRDLAALRAEAHAVLDGLRELRQALARLREDAEELAAGESPEAPETRTEPS